MQVLARTFPPRACILWALTFAIALLLPTGVARADGLSFCQIDFDLEGNTYTDTEWGALTLTYTGRETFRYLNVTVNGSWQVQNIPLISRQGVGVEHVVSLSFDLGVTRGTNLTALDYGYSLTEDVLTVAPVGSIPAVVEDRQVTYVRGSQDTDVPPTPVSDPPPATPAIGGKAEDESKKHAHTGDFPNQETKEGHCVPAAVSNSLQFLNDKYKLGLSATDISIDTLAEKFSTSETRGTHPGRWVDRKKEWIKDGEKIVTITTKSWIKVIEAIDQGYDVEIMAGRRAPYFDGHCAALVSITPLAGGGYDLEVADDTNQGDDTDGTKKDGKTEYWQVRVDAEGTLLWHPLFLRAKWSYGYAVIEIPIPEPATVSLLALGLLPLIRRRA